MNRKYTVIIPIFNQHDLVVRCLNSVFRNTDPTCASVLVVDDASTDRRLIKLLDEMATRAFAASRSAFGVLRHSTKNEGFVRSVNDAFDFTSGDVVILNSDTEVPPGWLEKLDAARTETEKDGAKVAAICPVSNYATMYSVPNAGTNVLPDWLSVEQMDALVTVSAGTSSLALQVPTCVGFCMLMTRAAIDAVGAFDGAFGEGYGEEVDWCLRARASGFECFLAPHLFVWHQGHASFGDSPARDVLRRNGESLVRERYPEYVGEVRAWYLEGNLRELRLRLFDALRLRAGGVRLPCKIWVLHSYDTVGGTEQVVRQQIREQVGYDHVVIWPKGVSPTDADVYAGRDGELCIAMNPAIVDADVTVRGYALMGGDCARQLLWFRQVLQALGKIAVVSFEHFAGWGTTLLLDVARDFCSDVRVFLHDEYAICPLFRLGGACTKAQASHADAECIGCLKEHSFFARPTTDADLVERLRAHRQEWEYLLERIHVSVPSRSLHGDIYGASGYRSRVQPHRIPALPSPLVERMPSASGKLRVVYVGLASPEKGWDAFAGAARLRGSDYEWHVLGYVDPSCDVSGLSHVRFHGAYKHDELGAWLRRFDIAAPALMRNESYGLVVDECEYSGITTVVSDVCVMVERYGMRPLYAWGDAVALVRAIDDASEHLREITIQAHLLSGCPRGDAE